MRKVKVTERLKNSRSRRFYWHLAVLLVLVSVLLFLGKGWLNGAFPAGVDTLSAPAQFWQIRSNLMEYGLFSGWNQYWYLGCWNSIIAVPQVVGLLILDHVWLKIFFLVNAALGGFFMYLFVLRLTSDRFAGLISGIFYSLSPFSLLIMGDAGFISLSIAYTIVPLVFMAVEVHFRKLTSRSAFIAGLAFACLLLTHRQVVILLGSLVALYMLFLLIRLIRGETSSRSRRVITGAKFLSPFVIALLLSAYWWLPFWAERDFLAGTYRSFSLVQGYSLSAVGSLTFWARYELTESYSKILAFFPLFLALFALVFERKNGNVMFFSVTSLIFITLSMGSNFPILLYEFAHKYVPFFNGIGTPARFLFAAAFSLAVLSGFSVKYLIAPFHVRKRLVIVSLVALVLLAGVYGESSRIFDTWDMDTSESKAMAWLAKQEGGRIVSLPIENWVWSETRGTRCGPHAGGQVNPWTLTYLHQKESLTGGIQNLQFRPTHDFRGIVHKQVNQGLVSHNHLLDVLGTRYVVLDGYYITKGLLATVFSDLTESDKYEEVFHSGNVAIFRNNEAFPRIFLQHEIKKAANMFEPNGSDWYQGQETQTEATFGWTEDIALGVKLLRCKYVFDNEGKDFFTIAKNLDQGELGDYDAFSFYFFVDRRPGDIQMVVNLFEKHGGRYRFPVNAGFREGWNHVEIPFSLFVSYGKKDSNRMLDKSEIETIWISIVETGSYAEPKCFSIDCHFAAIKYEYVFDDITFTLIHPGKYAVAIKADEPGYLVLAESYHPRWVAKDSKTGEAIAEAEPVYVALNGFWLEKGNYELILEYEDGLPHKVGNTLSILTLIACLGYLAKNPLQRLLRRKRG